jgi:hypothetical protein
MTIEPGLEARRAAKRPQACDATDERPQRRLVGAIVVFELSLRQGIHRALMTLDENLEGLPGAAEGASDDSRIIHARRSRHVRRAWRTEAIGTAVYFVSGAAVVLPLFLVEPV